MSKIPGPTIHVVFRTKVDDNCQGILTYCHYADLTIRSKMKSNDWRDVRVRMYRGDYSESLFLREIEAFKLFAQAAFESGQRDKARRIKELLED